jgi:hypothetical protein
MWALSWEFFPWTRLFPVRLSSVVCVCVCVCVCVGKNYQEWVLSTRHRSEDDDVIDAINFLLSSDSLSLTDSEAHSGPFLLLLYVELRMETMGWVKRYWLRGVAARWRALQSMRRPTKRRATNAPGEHAELISSRVWRTRAMSAKVSRPRC